MFARLVAELRALTPGLIGQERPEWGARSPGSRQGIRLSLKQSLSSLSDIDLQALNNYSEPPRPAGWSVSVSHTHNLGGWMAIPRPAQVGWDVELKARIQQSTIERVCTTEELSAAPRSEFLWCAKEAYFKALEDEQPVAITQLTIVDWQAHGHDMWRWQGLGPRNGVGLLLDAGEWLMAAITIP